MVSTTRLLCADLEPSEPSGAARGAAMAPMPKAKRKRVYLIVMRTVLKSNRKQKRKIERGK